MRAHRRLVYLRSSRIAQAAFLFHKFKEREFAAKEKLEIVSARGGAAHFCSPHPSRAKRGERMQFELF